MVYITRRETFNAAHRIYKPEWSNEKNFEVFGGCSNPNWHGHNYTLFVTVKAELNRETGFVMNLKTLSKIIKEKIITPCDHKNLNLEVDFLKGIQPTTENLSIAFWKVLEPEIEKYEAKLHCIKLCETENNYVEYFGL